MVSTGIYVTWIIQRLADGYKMIAKITIKLESIVMLRLVCLPTVVPSARSDTRF